MPMTNEEYVKNQGLFCPFCTSKNIFVYGNPQIDESNAWVSVECHDCGKEWNDIYHLVGYEGEE